MRFRWGYTLALGVALVGCQASAPSLTLPAPSSLASVSPTPVDLEPLNSAVRVVVRWPDRDVAFIPYTAETMDLAIYPGNSENPAMTKRVARSSGESGVVFEPLPAGPARITATARDKNGLAVAMASTTLILIANTLVPAGLSLQPVEPLAIKEFFPKAVIPGDQVTLVGTGFNLENVASYSIMLGDTVIPSYLIYRFNYSSTDYRFAVFIPKGVPRGRFSVSMGPYSAQSSESFTAIASVSIAPLEIILPPGGTHSMTVSAYDSDGTQLNDYRIGWSMENEDCLPPEGDPARFCEDNDAAKVYDGLIVAELDVGKMDRTTSPWTRLSESGELVAKGDIVAGNSYIRATASVKVQIP